MISSSERYFFREVLLQRGTSSERFIFIHSRSRMIFSSESLLHHQTMEVNSDVLELIISKMDNKTIRSLSLVPVLWDQVSSFIKDQHFWRLRVETLMNRELVDEGTSEQDWKKAYYSLEQFLAQGPNPFWGSILSNRLVVQILLESGYDPSVKDNAAIGVASEYGYIEAVKLLLKDKRVDPSAKNNYSVRFSSKYGHAEVVKLLLQDKRVDPSADNNYAIIIASENRSLEIIRLLLQDKRVDPSVENDRAIKTASRNGHTEVVKLLLQDKRVDPSVSDNYPIEIASRNGHTEVVKLLLQDPRVDPSAQDNYALLSASVSIHTEVAKLLLQDPRVNDFGKTASDILRRYNYHSPSIVNVAIQDKNTNFQAMDLHSMIHIADYISEYISDSVEGYKLLGTDAEYLDVYSSFNEYHYNMLLQQIILKRLDLEYYLEWILNELKKSSTSSGVRRIFSSAAGSILNGVYPVHLSPSFTAYRGFILLTVSDNGREILRILSEEEGVTQNGLELAGGLIGAFLGETSLRDSIRKKYLS